MASKKTFSAMKEFEPIDFGSIIDDVIDIIMNSSSDTVGEDAENVLAGQN